MLDACRCVVGIDTRSLHGAEWLRGSASLTVWKVAYARLTSPWSQSSSTAASVAVSSPCSEEGSITAPPRPGHGGDRCAPGSHRVNGVRVEQAAERGAAVRQAPVGHQRQDAGGGQVEAPRRLGQGCTQRSSLEDTFRSYGRSRDGRGSTFVRLVVAVWCYRGLFSVVTSFGRSNGVLCGLGELWPSVQVVVVYCAHSCCPLAVVLLGESRSPSPGG